MSQGVEDRAVAGIDERVVDAVPPAMIGRTRELATLTDLLAGPPRVVLVEGEAGVGKSRLLREALAAHTAASAPARVLRCWCPPIDEPHTLAPIVDAVRRSADSVGELGLSSLAGALRPLFPEWCEVLPPNPDPAEDATAARHRVFAALAELLNRRSVSWLVVEDIHWADQATLEFLASLVCGDQRRFGLVATSRPEEPAGSRLLRRLSRMAAGVDGVRISLQPLDRDEVRGLMSSMLSGQRVCDDLVTGMHRRTEGLPLAVEECLRGMVERSEVVRLGDDCLGSPAAQVDDVPPAIRDLVLDRMSRLDRDTQQVLRAASVLSAPADKALLAGVSALSTTAVQGGLAEVVKSGLLQESPEHGFFFKHVLASTAVYQDMDLFVRREMHERAARLIVESGHPVSALSVARHFRAAGQTAEWCRYRELAVDRSLAVGDEVAAEGLLIGMLTEPGLPPEEMCRLAGRLPPFLGGSEGSDYTTLIENFDSAINADSADHLTRAKLRFQLGRILSRARDVDNGRAVIEQAIPDLEQAPAILASALLLLGWPLGTESTREQHLSWLQRSHDVGASVAGHGVGQEFDEITARVCLGEDEAWARAKSLPLHPPDSESALDVARGNVNIADTAIMWGGYREATERLQAAVEISDSRGYRRVRQAALSTGLRLRYYLGDWDDLAANAEAMASDAEAETDVRTEATLAAALLQAARGQSAEARVRLALHMNEMSECRANDRMMEPAAALAELQLADGAVDEAVATTEHPIRVLAHKRVWLWGTEIVQARVAALAAAGATAEATDLVDKFASGLGCTAPAPLAAAASCRARVAVALGEWSRAEQLFQDAVVAWAGIPRPYEESLAIEQRALCLLELGREDQGLRLLAHAAEQLARLGATVAADRAQQAIAIRSSGDRARRARGRPGFGNALSPREAEVVALVAEGLTNREIAATLTLSPRTVGGHLDSAMGKLRVSTRTALAVAALERGLVPNRSGVRIAATA